LSNGAFPGWRPAFANPPGVNYLPSMTTAHGKIPASDNSSLHNARLRTLGLIVLILGLGGAATVYWLESHSASRNEDPAMVGYSRQETRQMETMYGTMGSMTDDLLNALKRPGVQAAIIAGISTVVGGGCLYFSRPAATSGKPTGRNDPDPA
jgi:hypothetical protein